MLSLATSLVLVNQQKGVMLEQDCIGKLMPLLAANWLWLGQ